MSRPDRSPVRRARLALTAATVAEALALGGVLLLGWLMTDSPPLWVVALAALAVAVTGPLLSLSAAVRRASAAVAMTLAVLVAIGVAAILGELTLLLVHGRIPSIAERTTVWAAVAGIVVAAGFARPLSRRATGLVQRWLHGARRSPEELLAAFGDRAARGVEAEDLLRDLAESLLRTYRLSAVELWTGDGTTLAPTVVLPTATTDPVPLDADQLRVLQRAGVAGPGWLRMWLPTFLDGRDGQIRAVPAVHADTVLALVVVRRPADDHRFTAREERSLAEVGRRLGIVLRNRALDAALRQTLVDLRHANEELRASRARLVAAADETRRRIERDLHDGAQQHLVALAVGLNLLRSAVPQEDQGTAELVDELDRGIRDTISDLRDLAHGIFPPLLRHSGLTEALSAAAHRVPLASSVRSEGVGRYSEAVEAAVYFCCVEAMQNAAKHAPGGTLRVELAGSDDVLIFRVTDDGPGFDRSAVDAGAGLQNMADRVGAIGGTVTWERVEGGGTAVVGRVPLERDHAGAA